jgi:hypothetical protein
MLNDIKDKWPLDQSMRR